ncbi:hypothetical protein [uncultured Hymenobacter sp.]
MTLSIRRGVGQLAANPAGGQPDLPARQGHEGARPGWAGRLPATK